MLRRYLLFAGYRYYPQGGMDDLVQDFDTYDELEEYVEGMDEEWYNVLDMQSGTVINSWTVFGEEEWP